MAMAAPAFASDVQVNDAWFRSLLAKLPAGGYFVLHNSGAQEISLVGAQSPVCSMLMLHRSTESGGMSSMEDVASVPVAAGAPCQSGAAGRRCDGSGNCVQCLTAEDCGASESCVTHRCAPQSCTDGLRDGDESDVDCGGPTCAPCASGKSCNTNLDCQAGLCSARTALHRCQ